MAQHLEHLENRGPALGVLPYPPEGAPCAYLGADGKLTARRAPLDIAVREPKNQNRRVGHGKTVPGPAGAGLLRFLLIDTLNVDDLVRDSSDHPEHAVAAQGVAHQKNGLSGEVVREVAVRELDHSRLRRQGMPPSSPRIPASRRRKPALSARESASEEGHRQKPGQTGAGVALPESCCATGRRRTPRRDGANEPSRRTSFMKRSASSRLMNTLQLDAEREVGREGVIDHRVDDHGATLLELVGGTLVPAAAMEVGTALPQYVDVLAVRNLWPERGSCSAMDEAGRGKEE